MSVGGESSRSTIEGTTVQATVKRLLFGDRFGLAIFLASVSLFAVYWIVDWRITDSLTLLNSLHALADGSLAMTEPVYGSSFDTPGVSENDGRLYGRNYGVLFVSLLPLALFRALGAVVDLRIAMAGLWVLGLLATALVVGRIIGRRRTAALWGSVGAVGLFAVNVALATDLDPTRAELYALQFTHLVAAGFVVVFLYRLLTRIHGTRVGLFGAALVALGTPVGLWATIPKRHIVTTAAFLAVAYALYRSREDGTIGTRKEVVYRAAAYAMVGLFAWVHAGEALTLFVALAIVDIPTADRNDVRALAAIAVTFFASLVPFFATNALAFGSPVKPPRLVGGPNSGISGGGTTGGPSGRGGGSGGLPDITLLLAPLDPVLNPLSLLFSSFGESLADLGQDPALVLRVFVRSSYLDGGWAAQQADYETVNLAVLESAPILAAISGVVIGSVSTLKRRTLSVRSWFTRPRGVVDSFIVLFSLLVALMYLNRLPLHAQVTMRYLLPIFPAIVYGIVRLTTLRALVANHLRPYAWTILVAVFIGGQIVVAVLATMELGRGEAFQFHALLGLATATPLAAWAVVGRSDGSWGSLGAILLGLATAATTVFLLLLTLEYWSMTGGPGVPIVRALADVVTYL